MSHPHRIAVVMACHNRRETTVKCLESLSRQQGSGPTAPAMFQMEVFLLDDASTDGTAAAAREAWPGIRMIQGNGRHFWCGGMRLAWERAAAFDPDYYLLLNDDTALEVNALQSLLELAPEPREKIIATAPIADPRNGQVVFGGHLGHDLVPVQPVGIPMVCDTMNANCTLIPRAVYRALGGLHGAYTHSMGDFDYGFKATRNGIRILSAGKILGYSEPNPTTGTWRDTALPRLKRLRLLLFSPTKGLPFFEWCTYCRRNYGWSWPLRCFSPIVRVIFR